LAVILLYCECEDSKSSQFKFKSTLVGSPSAISIASVLPCWLPEAEHIRYIDIRMS
jgi:hypothetical protein